MATTLDLSDDYQFFDNTESVNVEIRSISQTVRVDNALRRSLSKREQESLGGLLTNSSVVWEIPVAEFGDAYDIQEGDFIYELDPDRPLTWSVVSASLATLRTRWRCVCNKQRAT
jgi:uncharacterized protein YerC